MTYFQRFCIIKFCRPPHVFVVDPNGQTPICGVWPNRRDEGRDEADRRKREKVKTPGQIVCRVLLCKLIFMLIAVVNPTGIRSLLAYFPSGPRTTCAGRENSHGVYDGRLILYIMVFSLFKNKYTVCLVIPVIPLIFRWQTGHFQIWVFRYWSV